MSEYSKYQQEMNEALDGSLSEAETEALQANLEPEANVYWDRLRYVDRLLRSTPMVGPAVGFSSRVMAAIAAIHVSQRRFGVGIALGLMAAAVITIPLFSVSFIVLARVVTDPGVLNVLFRTAASVGTYMADLVIDLGSGVQNLVDDTPMLPALVSTAIPLSMLWVWLVWYLSGGSSRTNQETA